MSNKELIGQREAMQLSMQTADNTKYCSADVAYSSIYSQAKKSVYLIDNYIGLRTLVLLKNASAGADMTNSMIRRKS